jgi:hypothetical protein
LAKETDDIQNQKYKLITGSLSLNPKDKKNNIT